MISDKLLVLEYVTSPTRLFRVRSTLTRTALASIVALLAALGATGCGGSGASNDVVAEIGSNSVSKATLNEWMTMEIGEDFFDATSHQVPQGLVSEPPNYHGCITALEAIEPIPGQPKSPPVPSVSELARRCQQLYQDIRFQALSYLVGAYSSITFAARHGIVVSDGDVEQRLRQIRAAHYPKHGEFEAFLAMYRRTVSQERFLVKQNMLTERMLAKARADGTGALERLEKEESLPSALIADCRPGYVVWHCKQYHGPDAYPVASPSILVQEIGRWRKSTSHGFVGVPVT